MPRTSKADAPVELDETVIEGRYVDLGGYIVGFETHKADMDPAELFRGLPDDRCRCPHWGSSPAAGWSSGTSTTTRCSKPATRTTAPPGTFPALRRHRGGGVQPDRPTERHDVRRRREPRSGQGVRPAHGGLNHGHPRHRRPRADDDRLPRTGHPPDGLFNTDVFCDFSLHGGECRPVVSRKSSPCARTAIRARAP